MKRTSEGFMLKDSYGNDNWAYEQSCEGWNAAVQTKDFDPPSNSNEYFKIGWRDAKNYIVGFLDAKSIEG